MHKVYEEGEFTYHFYAGYFAALQWDGYTVAKGYGYKKADANAKRAINDALPPPLRDGQHQVRRYDILRAIAQGKQGCEIASALSYPADSLASLGVLLGVKIDGTPEAWTKLSTRLEVALRRGLEPIQKRNIWYWSWL